MLKMYDYSLLLTIFFHSIMYNRIMSKKSNNRLATVNKLNDINQVKYRKCSHHIYSHNYVTNMKQHDELMNSSLVAAAISTLDPNKTINIKIAFHFMAPRNSYSREKVLSRVHDIVQSINDDFNNYSTNENTMNNFKYKSVINQVFLANDIKQSIYYDKEHMNYLPTKPSNIVFQFGEIYYYPIESRLDLSNYDDTKDVEIQHQIIKKYIHLNGASALEPTMLLNIWIIDMFGTSILGFSNFPWETIDPYHGIIINRRAFFPEDYNETNFNMFKTFTHEIGHYLGLLHVLNKNSNIDTQIVNINADENISNMNELPSSAFDNLSLIFDPTDRETNKKLHTDTTHNPLFMNFMDYTNDKYVTMFTNNQIIKMRYMIETFRPNINSIITMIQLPIPKYNPDTGSYSGNQNRSKKIPTVPPKEQLYNYNPRSVTRPIDVNEPNSKLIENQKIMGLIPGLTVIEPKREGNAADQILANIQSVMPIEKDDDLERKMELYKNNLKKQQDYNSQNGYAQHYPHDSYNSAQTYNNMALYNQMNQMNQMNQSNQSNPNEFVINTEINEDAVNMIRKNKHNIKKHSNTSDNLVNNDQVGTINGYNDYYQRNIYTPGYHNMYYPGINQQMTGANRNMIHNNQQYNRYPYQVPGQYQIPGQYQVPGQYQMPVEQYYNRVGNANTQLPVQTQPVNQVSTVNQLPIDVAYEQIDATQTNNLANASAILNKAIKANEEYNNIKKNINENQTNPQLNHARLIAKASSNDTKRRYDRFGRPVPTQATGKVNGGDVKISQRKFTRTRPAATAN